MSNTITLTTGNDIAIPYTLELEDATFSIDLAAEVKVRIISLDHNTNYTSEVVQNSSATGADWANSKIIVEIPEAIMDEILAIDSIKWKNGKVTAKLEIQIDDNGKDSWFDAVHILKGTIT